MSLLINEELIWISIPRNASHSIERAFYSSNLKVENFISNLNNLKPGDQGFIHNHSKLDDMCEYWKNKKSLCVKRDYMDRWLSALNYTWEVFKKRGYETVIDYEDIDNDFIYKTFDLNFGNILYGDNGMMRIIKYFIKNNLTESELFENRVSVFFSENYWIGTDKKCDFEFNIKETDKLEKFIEGRYGEKIKIERFNQSKNVKNKIVVDDDLRHHIWNIFEKPFVKVKKIL